MSETVAEKAGRYLVEARLTVVAVKTGVIEATCRGSGAVYRLGWTRGAEWHCDCRTRGLCSHLLALQTVTVANGDQ